MKAILKIFLFGCVLFFAYKGYLYLVNLFLAGHDTSNDFTTLAFWAPGIIFALLMTSLFIVCQLYGMMDFSSRK